MHACKIARKKTNAIVDKNGNRYKMGGGGKDSVN